MDANYLFITAMMGGASGKGGDPMTMIMPMLIIFGIFYFMLIRPQQRKEKERRAMIDEVKTGDKILFSGGIMGSVTNTKESTLVIKIADGVKIEIARGAVVRVLDKNEKVSVEENK
jgi:preprotein translocase subunit YajC